MRRRLRFCVSVMVFAWDCVAGAALFLLRGGRQPRCVVLYYHAVPAGQREHFAHQMDLLTRSARPVSTDPAIPLKPGADYAAVTFDDGFLSVLENASPELKKRKIPWTMFVPSNWLGQQPGWLRHAGDAARQDRVLTADELRILAQDPLVTIGAHTAAHVNLLKVSPEQAKAELAESKSALEHVLGRPVQQFSYPFGARNPSLDRHARTLGYQRAFCSLPVPAFTKRDEFLSGRVSVEPHDSPLEFRLKLAGAYRWRGWLQNFKAAALSLFA